MKTRLQQIAFGFTKINSNHIRLALLALTLALFVLGAAAPLADGGIGG